MILDLIKEDSRQFENLSDFFKHVENQIDLEDAERQALEREREAKREDKTPKVTISSIHRSKGKEWDHVFVFDLHDPEKVRRATSEKKIGSSKILLHGIVALLIHTLFTIESKQNDSA